MAATAGWLACGGPPAKQPPTVQEARASASLGTDRSALYATVTNPAREPDTLVQVDVGTGRASMHVTTVSSDGIMLMAETEALEVPPRGFLRLSPGGAHVMIEGLARPLREGDSIDVVLRFTRAGEMALRVPVVSPSAAASGP